MLHGFLGDAESQYKRKVDYGESSWGSEVADLRAQRVSEEE